MAILATAVNVIFTSTRPVFRVQCTDGSAKLQARMDVAAQWADVVTLPTFGLAQQQVIIDNTPEASYRFLALDGGSPVVRAGDDT